MKIILNNTSLTFKTVQLITENPFKAAYPTAFTSSTNSDYPTTYGYTYYGFTCRGIRIRGKAADNTVKVYHGSTLIKTHTYAEADTFEDVIFDTPVEVTESNPIKVQGSFYYMNQTVDAIDGIDTIGHVAVHVDFWFLFPE